VPTYEEYLAAPDPWKKAEFVRGEIIYRQPGPVAHALAISNLLGAWHDYVARRAGLSEPYSIGSFFDVEQSVAGDVLPNVGIRYALPDDPDQVRALSLSIFTHEQYSRLRGYSTEHPDDFVPEPPALAIDNVFPNDLSAYTVQKVSDLLAAGSQTVWLFYPLIPCIVVWTHDRVARLYGPNDTLPEPAGFPGYALSVSHIYEWSK
jgi:hypothetical protein